MANYIIPHTAEWFELLARFNPQQAAQTRTMINLSGTENCCSVCGDTDGVADFYLDEGGLPEASVATFRLCPDCVSIRTAGGERLRRFPEASAQ